MVPSEIIVICWALLDVRFNGDDDSLRSWACTALRLGNQQIPTSNGHDSCVSRHDAKQHFLGKSQR